MKDWYSIIYKDKGLFVQWGTSIKEWLIRLFKEFQGIVQEMEINSSKDKFILKVSVIHKYKEWKKED